MTQPNRLFAADRSRYRLTLRLVLCLGVLIVAHSAPWTAAQVEHRYYLPALMVGRQIAFASDRGGNFYQDLYLMEPDGTNVVRVPGPDSVMCPAWSPSGDRLAFASPLNQDIWMMNPDGSGLVQLTTGPSLDFSPSWSPDGAYVVFGRISANGGGSLSVVRVGESNPVPIITSSYAGFLDPAWSPDGSQLAFASNLDGNMDIYIASVVSTQTGFQMGALTRLTQNPYWDVDPSWSLDGQTIAYSASSYSDNDIFSIRIDGSDNQQLTFTRETDEYPHWSPDGSQILFTSWRDGNAEIYIMNADGSNQTNLTQSLDRDVCASWRR